MLRRLIEKIGFKRSLPKAVSYEDARGILEEENQGQKRALASREDAKPEMLYYLAEDEDAGVRACVAANLSAPPQSNMNLADDVSDEVRGELASKIGRLIPGLSDGETNRVREMAIAVLEKLAQDQAPRVRQILAEEIKSTDCVPTHIIQKLARDIEIAVCGPILEYSPLLTDDDLLEIVATGKVQGAIESIASRADVSEDVSDALVATLDVTAVAALLNNENAQIREETLDRIIDNAEGVEEWHRPVTMRPELSLRALRRVAGFVAFSILEDLSEHTDLSSDVEAFLKKRVRERLETEQDLEPGLADKNLGAERARDLIAARNMKPDQLQDAIDAGDREFVVAALSGLTGNTENFVNRILSSRTGKAITALCWRSGMPMRVALSLQSEVGKVPPTAMVMAKDGVDYSMTPDEMEWQLRYFESKGH